MRAQPRENARPDSPDTTEVVDPNERSAHALGRNPLRKGGSHERQGLEIAKARRVGVDRPAGRTTPLPRVEPFEPPGVPCAFRGRRRWMPERARGDGDANDHEQRDGAVVCGRFGHDGAK